MTLTASTCGVLLKKFGFLTSSLFYWTQKVQNRVEDYRTHFCITGVIVREMRSRPHSCMTETHHGKVSIRRQYFQLSGIEEFSSFCRQDMRVNFRDSFHSNFRVTL